MPLPDTELTLLFEGPEPTINVFIHGYSAVATANQMNRLANYILRARPQGKVYLLYWKSGDWKKSFAPPVISTTLRVFRVSRLFHPAALAADAAVTIGLQSYQFKKKERLAERLGQHLPELLAQIPDIKEHQLNLFGHSLGGRAIQTALQEHHWDHLNLHDCLVMASAGDRDDYLWDHEVQKLKGSFYNVYSNNDLTLKISPDLRSRVGRHPIPSMSDQIINIPFHEYRHTDYWPNLGTILKKSWPAYTPSEHLCTED